MNRIKCDSPSFTNKFFYKVLRRGKGKGFY